MPQCGCRGFLFQPPSLFPLYIHSAASAAAAASTAASVPPCERTFVIDVPTANDAARPAKRAKTTAPKAAAALSITVEQGWHARVHELGTAVWESSAVTLRWLEQHRDLVAGKSVLELGAGPGLIAIACAALGAERVVCSDNNADVLALARRNVARSVADGIIAPSAVRVVEYCWGAADAAALGGGKWDLIIGADIMYLPTLYAEIAAEVHALLRPRTGVVLLVATLRGVALPEALVQRIVDDDDASGGEELGLEATWHDAAPFVARCTETRPETWERWAPKGIAMCTLAHAEVAS